MGRQTIGRMKLPWIVVLLAAVSQLSAASISATVTMGQNYCRVASFPRGWGGTRWMKTEHSNFELGSSRLEFRSAQADTTELLTGIYRDYGPKTLPEDYSPTKYWVDMRHGGRARRATDEEWNAGFRLGALSTPFLNGVSMPDPPKDSEDLVLQGRPFKKSGSLWPSAYQLTRASQDKQWVMVQSFGGKRTKERNWGNGDFWQIKPDIFMSPHGTFFLDIYAFATAQKVIAIYGSIRGDGSTPGDAAMWLKSRYFVAPIQQHFKELLVCDMKDLLPEEKKLR